MKRILSILLALLLVFSLSACERQNNVSAWYNSKKAKSDARDGYLGSWVWGQYYEETLCYDREINIESIDDKYITFTIDYYRIWSSNMIVAEISKKGVGCFKTDELTGEIYIDSNNILHLNIEKSSLSVVSTDNIKYSKNTDVEDYNDNLTSDNNESPNETTYKQYCYYSVHSNTVIISQSPYPGECKFKVQCDKCGSLSTETYTCNGYNPYQEFAWYTCKNCGKSTCGYINCETRAVVE